MDEIEASGTSTTPETFTFGTIEMGLRAKIVTPASTPHGWQSVLYAQ